MNTTSHIEKLISALGGLLAILAILLISQSFLGLDNSWAIVASMGASAVLLFAVPKGPLSQPWPVFGGHMISALIGVSCALLIDDKIIAASIAAGLSIAAMYYLDCIHPPGGATALTAVLGGTAINDMGYQFLVTPVLLNIVVILFIAIAFNSLFHWRRYPNSWHNRSDRENNLPLPSQGFSHEDFLAALKEIDTFVDVNEAELQRIFNLASVHANRQPLNAADIKLGGIYSNGQFGKHWSMRQIIDESADDNNKNDYVIFRQIAGTEPKRTDCVTRQEFANWALYEMEENNGQWQRKTIRD